MRKVKGIRKVLVVLLCVSLMLQEVPMDVFAAEEGKKAGILECLLEDETGHSEIESITEENAKTWETENLMETKEQGDDSEIEQVSQIGISSEEAEESESNLSETNVGKENETFEIELETESENEENTFDEEIYQDGDVLSGKCGDDLTWKIEGGTLTISGTGDMWDYETIWDDNIGSITTAPWGKHRFSLNKLIINQGVTGIGECAFTYMEFEDNLVLPNSVISIRTGAFGECEKFSGDLVIPSNVTNIGDGAFEGCIGFNKKLILPNSIINIGNGAFSNCQNFSGDLILPDNILNLGESAFASCGFKGKLVLPKNITNIGIRVFENCDFTGNFEIPSSVTSIGVCAFEGCIGFSGDLIIPSGVTKIGRAAFRYCRGFDGSLIISDNVTSISSDAFQECSGFKEKLILPKNVNYIGDNVFSECSGFSHEVVIPTSITSIGGQVAFSGKQQCMGEDVFRNCTNLKDIYIAETLKEIINNPFQQIEYNEDYEEYGGYDPSTARNLNLTFHCPKNSYAYNWAVENGFKVVDWDGTTIGGDNPSDNKTSGKCGDNLTWKLENKNGDYTLTISGTGAMYDYALESNTSTAPWAKQIKSKTVTLNIESGVTSIGKYAFYNCENLNGNIILPNTIASIGDDAFYNCTGVTDIYIWDTLTQIGRNPFRYFNALIGTFKNMEVTLHCIKNSYAYKWAKDNGFNVEEWDGVAIDIKKNDITINGKGYAYARFLLKDNNGQVQKNAKISYRFGGNSYTATSDKDGYVQIKSELISDNKDTKKQIKTTEIILDPNGKKEKLNSRVVMDVKVTPFTYTQKWNVGMSGSVDLGFSDGISAKIGVAEAEASLGKAYATGTRKGTIALEIEHSGDEQNVKLEQNFNSRIGLKANGGVETKAIAFGKGIDIGVLSVSGSAGVGAGQGIGLQIDDYNPASFNDNLNIGKFAIAMIGSQTGNGMLIRLVDLMGVDLYNTSDKSVGFYAKAGASAGTIKYDGKELGTIRGIENSINYTYTNGKNEFDKTLSQKMELEESVKVNSEVKIPLTDKVTMAENILSRDYLNSYAVELIENYDRVPRKLKIDLKTANEKTQYVKDKKKSKSLSVEFDALDTQKLEQEISSLHQLKLGNLPFITMMAAKDDLLTQIDKAGVNGEYHMTQSTSVGNSTDFELGGSLGAKLDLGMGIEGLYDLTYNTESGIYQNGSIIKTSEVSDVSNFVAGTKWNDFTDFFTDPVEIALNNAKNFIVDIGEAFADGIVDTYVTLKTTAEDGIDAIEKWVLHVVKIDGGNQKQRMFNSYGIMAVNAAPNGDVETEKVVFTIGDPYYVYVTDANEQEINNFENYPLELTLKYTNEMLNAAGVSANDAENISIYQYSEELYGYVCIGGTIDTKKQEVKTEIKEAGQYLLAVDTSAPTVSEVCISKDTNKPLITVYFDEMSGFQKLSFCLDGQELIDDSNWKKYYNAASFCISYQVEKELSDGAHKLSVYAVDSAGNAMSEPFVFEFHIGEVKPDYGDILPEDIPADGTIPEGLWISDVTPQDYAGAAIKPAVRVYDYKTLLTEKKDYTISYKNNIKANDAKTAKTAPTIIVTGKGNYTGKETTVFQIVPKTISDEDIDIDDFTLAYNKKVQKPIPQISWNGKRLKPKTDFQIKYTDTSSQAYQRVGNYKVLISGTGNFSGQKEVTLTITDKKLIAKTKIDKIDNQPYTGKEIKPEVSIKDGKTLLKKGKDYVLNYNNNTEIGKASVTITGMGAYSGTKKVTFNITGGSIAQAKITGLKGKMPYTGSAITQDCKLTITINGSAKTLKKDTDYIVSYANNINAGKATMIFKGINGFDGIQKQSFIIEAFDISNQSDKKCEINISRTVPYVKGGSTPKPVITFHGTVLCEGVDYVLSYKNNKEIMDKAVSTNKKSTKLPQVIIKGKGNYKGTRILDFQISTQDISNLRLNAADKMYQNKKGVYGTKVEIVDVDGKKLSAGKDYDKNLTYTYAADTKLSNDVIRKAGSVIEKNDIMPAGTSIQVTATGKGSYKGTISGVYRITKADISKASIKIADQIYTGKSIEPNASDLTVIINGKTLGSDCYEIVKYDNNVNKGKALITINGVGDYGGVKIVPFKIKSKGFLWWWKK